jgi:hypothetical protein
MNYSDCYESTSYFSDVLNALGHYGYSGYYQQPYNWANVNLEIISCRPLYFYGENSLSSSIAHGWVCDGSMQSFVCRGDGIIPISIFL